FALQGISEADLIDFAPELREAALEIVAQFELGSVYTPPSLAEGDKLGTLHVPSAAGGANWGGAGFDPESGYLFLQSANQPSFTALQAGSDTQGSARYFGSGRALDTSSLNGLP